VVVDARGRIIMVEPELEDDRAPVPILNVSMLRPTKFPLQMNIMRKNVNNDYKVISFRQILHVT
jgi:hypothetical protein